MAHGWLTRKTAQKLSPLRRPKPEPAMPKITVWNVNNRVGRTTFRPEAAHAAMALDADVIVLNEFFPGAMREEFLRQLRHEGWSHQRMSPEPSVQANRVLFASRIPIESVALPPSTVDEHLTSNAAAVSLPDGAIVVGIRVPTYEGDLLRRAWDWVERLALILHGSKSSGAVIVGDLNTSMSAKGAKRIPQFHRMLEGGWRRAQPAGQGGYRHVSGTWHEIDHVLACGDLDVANARYVTDAAAFSLAGRPDSLSDHSALTFDLVNRTT